mgnify:CR=1 FL=1
MPGRLVKPRSQIRPLSWAIGTTGVIGVELPMALIRAGIPNIKLSEQGGTAFARAIMTTDPFPKETAVAVDTRCG